MLQSWDSSLYTSKVSGHNVKKYCILLSEDLFTYTNSVDPYKMPHCAAFHLGLRCLQKYSAVY